MPNPASRRNDREAGASSALPHLDVPVVLAPLAGGPATVDLAVAVSEAGGLGFLAAGYRPTDTVREQIEGFRARTAMPLGVNVFSPPQGRAPETSYQTYLQMMAAEAKRLGVEPGTPRFDDDEFVEKVELLTRLQPDVVSFVFGCPSPEVIAQLREACCRVLVTVTTPEEAEHAAAAGASGLVVQGYEAGGHRGSAVNEDRPGYGLLSLLQLVGSRVSLPLVAAGGISTGPGLAAVLAAGAAAGQIGTAFLLCPEAGTASVHRDAIATRAPTAVTRAFTGKPARGIINRFITEYSDAAPAAYPEIHHVTSPLRAAGRQGGDPDVVNLWAGQTHELARQESTAEVVRRLAEEARAALREACRR